MSKFSEIIAYNWTGKVEAFESMGAQFTKDCGGGTSHTAASCGRRTSRSATTSRASMACASSA
jgi:hypothetical protein